MKQFFLMSMLVLGFNASAQKKCMDISNLTVTYMTPNEAGLFWTKSTAPSSPTVAAFVAHDVYLSTSDVPPSQYISSYNFQQLIRKDISDATLEELAPSTKYYAWVRSRCGGPSLAGNWMPVTFTTPPAGE